MEEKYVRGMSAFIAAFAVFICASLYYLPSLEAGARTYMESRMRERDERREREKMWTELSGTEFLDYSTRQAMAAGAGGGTDNGRGRENLGFSQQLRLELPKNTAKDDVTIVNDYVTHTVSVTIRGAGGDYLIGYPMIGRSDHIENLSYFYGEDSGTVELELEHAYELSEDWDGRYLYLDFIEPRGHYDKIVVIDAGHGAGRPGAIVSGVYEKDIDLAIVKELKALFDESQDVKDGKLGVFYTRLDDSDPDFADRSGLPNDLGANLFVSIHSNSYPQSASVHGTTVLYDETEDASGNSSKHLAKILLDKTTAAAGSNNMGLIAGSDIYIIRTSEAPAALVEIGFMTNPEELRDLDSPAYQKKCARGIYDGIMQALGEGY